MHTLDCSSSNLLEKYKPWTLSDIIGQSWIVHQLQLFAEAPYPVAFLFEGGTGVGKTCTALCLARELGVAVDDAEFGGLYQIASGEQTGESVRKMMAGLNCRPFCGSGWKMLIVNEADAMTANAAHVWLDALENLPAKTVVVFTTNHAGRLPSRLRDRCERLAFLSGPIALLPAAQELVNRIWQDEVGCPDAPRVEEFGTVTDEHGDFSFRRLLQRMTPWVRSGQRPEKREEQVSQTISIEAARSRAAKKAWQTRRAKQKGVSCG